MYKNKALNKLSLEKEIIDSMKKALFKRILNSKEKGERITELSSRIGKEISLSKGSLKELEQFVILKDIGKICVDNQALIESTKIREKKYFEINNHCETGYRIAMALTELNSIADSLLT